MQELVVATENKKLTLSWNRLEPLCVNPITTNLTGSVEDRNVASQHQRNTRNTLERQGNPMMYPSLAAVVLSAASSIVPFARLVHLHPGAPPAQTGMHASAHNTRRNFRQERVTGTIQHVAFRSLPNDGGAKTIQRNPRNETKVSAVRQLGIAQRSDLTPQTSKR
jgi:hypothetical protein